MKKYWNKIALAAAAAIMAACAPTYPEPTASGLPQASALDVNIQVDQETNYVTFTMNNKGMVPVWIFGDQKIDGKASKKYAYTMNGVSLRFREAGEYTVEVKAYNANGISEGSLVKTFTMENTYRDPFDPTPYVNAVSGGSSQNWVWNSTVDGHFGCGDSVENPKGWWSCGANGKEGFLYDDIMTFASNGEYTYNPGDGKGYANKGSEYKAEFKTADEDYLFDTELKTSKYTFESNWNDAGIEEIYLVMESGSEMSYVPHKSIVEEPRYLVVDSKPADMKKKLEFVAFVKTPDNPDGIAWYYEFVPEGSGGEEPEPDVDPLDPTFYDVDGETNLWKGIASLDVETWYSPGDWSGGLTPEYEITAGNGITVTIPEGVGGSEWMGQTKLKSHIASSADKEYDLSVTLLADEDMTVTIKLTNDPEGADDVNAFFYDGNVQLTAGEPLVYRRHNLKQKVSGDNVMLIFDFGRSPVGSTIAASEVLFQEHKDANLWPAASLDVETWYSPADWSGGITPEYEITAGNGITVTIPEGVGGSEWMGQTKLKSHIASSADKTYALSVKFTASEDMTVTVKLTNDPEGADDVNAFFYDGNVKLAAGETLLYVKRGLSQKQSGDNVMLIFDFGRSPVGSVIEASEIIFMEE